MSEYKTAADFIPAIEAILFAAGDPVPKTAVAAALELDEDRLDEFLLLLEEEFASARHGIMLRRIGDSIALATKPALSQVMASFFSQPIKATHLSQAAYETLAVIAYNEQVTRAQIDSVRGVNSDAALNRLIEKGLVEMSGTLDLPGRPAVFKTTELFLRLYGITSLDELEPLDMLMYDSVQDFEQAYRKTSQLAVKVSGDDGLEGDNGVELSPVNVNEDVEDGE